MKYKVGDYVQLRDWPVIIYLIIEHEPPSSMYLLKSMYSLDYDIYGEQGYANWHMHDEIIPLIKLLKVLI